MPHIHTSPSQHDFTTSAYIIRKVDGEWKCLVHLHKKLGKLLQVGGHIELDETPWQALAHELVEESGYELTDLKLLQIKSIPKITSSSYITHPIPFVFMTHKFSLDHYHTDLGYAFVAKHEAKHKPQDAESQDLRWYTLGEIDEALKQNMIVVDVADTYQQLVANVSLYEAIDAVNFSLNKPTVLPTESNR